MTQTHNAGNTQAKLLPSLILDRHDGRMEYLGHLSLTLHLQKGQSARHKVLQGKQLATSFSAILNAGFWGRRFCMRSCKVAAAIDVEMLP